MKQTIDFDAFQRKWVKDDGLYCCPFSCHEYVYSAAGAVLAVYQNEEYQYKIGSYPTLPEAQTAAYAHFLQSRNESNT